MSLPAFSARWLADLIVERRRRAAGRRDAACSINRDLEAAAGAGALARYVPCAAKGGP